MWRIVRASRVFYNLTSVGFILVGRCHCEGVRPERTLSTSEVVVEGQPEAIFDSSGIALSG
jgi:hypothetical protein